MFDMMFVQNALVVWYGGQQSDRNTWENYAASSICSSSRGSFIVINNGGNGGLTRFYILEP
jgi:hypothetical protein